MVGVGRSFVVGFVFCAFFGVDASAGVCDGPAARRALGDLIGHVGDTGVARGRSKAAVGVFRHFDGPVERASAAGPDAWLFVHAGAPLYVRANVPAGDVDTGVVSFVTCAYAVSARRFNEVKADDVVRGFRIEQRSSAASDVDPTPLVAVPGLSGFSFDSEWRGERLVTLVFVEGKDGTRYQLSASTSP